MEFLQHILSAAGADTLRAFTVVPGFGGYFKGVGGITCFSCSRIALAVGGSAVEVVGEGLSVGRFFAGDLFIKGRISEIRID